MAVITVKNESLRFITGDIKHIGIKEYVTKKLRGKYHVGAFWANKDISFSLEKGDMLGIIGKNGAGKSTLLKAVSGVLVPTEGQIRTKGSIAALLELTAGFDGSLTVKENTYLRGALLGYTRKYMDEMYDEIIEFAEMGEFQDRQFNQLSSGMKSRLAFSIACLVNPDILILDEVLSVGDGSFRGKSAAKMREILSKGVTGLFVSHSVSQVRELCNKVLWLDHGKQIIFSPDVAEICNCYEEFLQTGELPQTEEDYVRMSNAWIERQAGIVEQEKVKRSEELRQELEKGGSEAALLAAMDIIRSQRPDLLYDLHDAGERPE